MQEKNWAIGVDIGKRITQISYMTDSMKEPETLEKVFETKEDAGFLKDCLLAIPELEELSQIKSIEIVLPRLTLEYVEKIKAACQKMGISSDTVRVQGVQEAAVYFALSQEKNLWNNEVVFFDFSREGMLYRRLRIGKLKNAMTAELLEEDIQSFLYDKPSDEEFLRFSREKMEKHIISAVYLIGEGFYGEPWATETLKYLCSRRRVFKGLNLYTKGAAYAAYDRIHANAFEKVIFQCKNRLKASVGIRIIYKEEPRFLYLVKAGENWCEARALIEAIPDEMSELTFVIQSLDGTEREETLSLKELPERERRMTRIEISLAFISENQAIFTVRDLGFGCFAQSSEMILRKDIRL